MVMVVIDEPEPTWGEFETQVALIEAIMGPTEGGGPGISLAWGLGRCPEKDVPDTWYSLVVVIPAHGIAWQIYDPWPSGYERARPEAFSFERVVALLRDKDYLRSRNLLTPERNRRLSELNLAQP